MKRNWYAQVLLSIQLIIKHEWNGYVIELLFIYNNYLIAWFYFHYENNYILGIAIPYTEE